MTAPELLADFFDGRSARAHRVRIRLDGGRLHLQGESIDRHVPLEGIVWSEYQRRGSRQAELPDGATLIPLEADAWDTLVRAVGRREALAVRASRSWVATLVAVAVIAAVGIGVWLWGIPLAATAAVRLVPAAVEQRIGDEVMASLREGMLGPTRLPEHDRERITAAFRDAVGRAFPGGDAPAWQLEFQRSRIGPNAFALPGGRMVMTDELVEFVARAGPDAEAMLVGVLAHELGHVRFRHGMRGVAQATLSSLAAALAFGDVSSLVAVAPALLLQQGYSRDFEREADVESVRILRAAGISPAVMASFFELLAQRPAAGSAAGAETGEAGSGRRRGSSALDIAFSSHPADAERIRFFRAAAQSPH